jgi:hypothetical protein
MDPFLISPQAAALMSSHPELSVLLEVLRNGDEEEIFGLCRLWISEGTPYVFSGEPMMYEAVRGWIAKRLSIHPKELTLIGSARMGYSLAPPPRLGTAFGTHSDLDLVAISQDLFFRYEAELQMFSEDLELGRVVPDTPFKEKLWPDIVADLKRTSQQRGFLDTWKIPYMERYPLAKRIGSTCWLLREKLRVSQNQYDVSKTSLRVYKDFHSFVRQMRINLNAIN